MNYSHIIGEAPMRMMNASVMVSRLDLVVLELAAAGIDFRRLPYGFWNIGVFIEQRGGSGGTQGGTTHQGMLGPPGAPWWVVPSSRLPPGATRAHLLPFGP